MLAQLAARHADRPALRVDRRVVTYAELDAGARRVADALARRGVSAGTRVGLLMPNRPDWLCCAFGIWRLGAVLVPLNTLFRAAELAAALHTAEVGVLICVERFLRHDYLRRLVEISPALASDAPPLRSTALPALRQVFCDGTDLPRGILDWRDVLACGTEDATPWSDALLDSVGAQADAAVFFTSGSTATPKGVVHTHASMALAAEGVADRLGLDADDVTYGYLPLFFNGGTVGVALATLTRGGCVLLQETFDAGETLRQLAEHGCTTLFAWPHQAEALRRHPDFDCSRLHIRKGPGANAPWAAALFAADHQAVATWGMTETGPLATCTRWDEPAATRAASHGTPMPGLELRIVDPQTHAPLPPGVEGEIAVRGPRLMRTYLGHDPRACFDGDGFFHTGDGGRLDANGRLHFTGRLKDVIKTAGVNVAAAEVEAVLAAHPQVQAVHVVPVPHATRGEDVAAFVVRRAAACTEADLRAHCAAALASYKVPRHIFFLAATELPTLGSGKVDRQALRRQAAELVPDRDDPRPR